MARQQKQNAEQLKAIVHSFAGVSVTVLADLVADEFVYGEIARVSREAPVLILKHRETHGGSGRRRKRRDEPGGARRQSFPCRCCRRRPARRNAAGEVSRIEHSNQRNRTPQGDTSPRPRRESLLACRTPVVSRSYVWTANLRRSKTVTPWQQSWRKLRASTLIRRTRCWFPTTATGQRPRHCLRTSKPKDLAETEAHHARLALPHAGVFRRYRGHAQRARSRRGARNQDRRRQPASDAWRANS